MKDFLKYLENNPFIGNQESCGIGDNYWNADMWTIEVIKAYCGNYNKSKKLKNNRNYDPNRIKIDAKIKHNMRKNLEDIKNETDFLLICEVGRGIDILIANNVKKWKKIYCYDQVDYSSYLNIFDNIEFYKSPSSIFNPDIILHDIIMIVNHSIYKPFENKNIIHAIIDGELKW